MNTHDVPEGHDANLCDCPACSQIRESDFAARVAAQKARHQQSAARRAAARKSRKPEPDPRSEPEPAPETQEGPSG